MRSAFGSSCYRGTAALLMLAECLALSWPASAAQAGEVLGLPSRPNIVLLTIDTLRADHTSAYGYQRNTTPSMDALSKSGIRFANAVSQAPWTLPALASIHTGLYPSEHGAIQYTSKLSDQITTIAEVLAANGFATFSVVAQDFAGRPYGLAQGFEFVDSVDAQQSHDTATSERLVEKALKLVSGSVKRPIFLWIHFFDPHFEYIRHERFGFSAPYLPLLAEGAPTEIVTLDFLGPHGRNPKNRRILTPDYEDFVRAVYDEEIAETDYWIGRLMEGLAERWQDEPTVTILTADHGEFFWEHGLMYHGGIVYSELVQVPLVISGPFAKAYRGHQVFREVETRSLARTIANIAGAENQSFGGENLLEIPTRIEKPRFAFSEGNLADSKGIRNRAVVHDGWKLIHRIPSGRHDLYHLVTDPKEQRNHWSSKAPEVVKKRDQLKRALQEFEENRRPVAPESRMKITPEAQERLRAMGYIE